MYALHNSTITCMHVLLDVLLFSRVSISIVLCGYSAWQA